MKLLADATLPLLEIAFPKPFELTLYNAPDQLPLLLKTHDALLCRSTLKINEELLKDRGLKSHHLLKCVATASSGIDHIDTDCLAKHNIQLFDAKGSNAHSVADYLMACIALLQQANKLSGMRVGVIGVGEVGSRVASRLNWAGFDVVVYDPLKAAPFISADFDELFSCDLLCIHANLHDTPLFPSKNLLNAAFFARLKPQTVIINAARGGIVDEMALLNAPHPIIYCTDVYCNEPDINPSIVDYSFICTPHIAGHSIEAKQAAVIQVSQQLHRYFGLTPPLINPSGTFSLKGKEITNWQAYVLSSYNPLDDSLILKAALDKKQAFLTQRKSHFRHDLNLFAD